MGGGDLWPPIECLIRLEPVFNVDSENPPHPCLLKFESTEAQESER